MRFFGSSLLFVMIYGGIRLLRRNLYGEANSHFPSRVTRW